MDLKVSPRRASVHRSAAAGREAKKEPKLLRSPNFSEAKAKLLRSGGGRLLRSRNQTSEKVRSNFKTEPMRRQNATSQKLLNFQFRPTISTKAKLLRSGNRTSQKSKNRLLRSQNPISQKSKPKLLRSQTGQLLRSQPAELLRSLPGTLGTNATAGGC